MKIYCLFYFVKIKQVKYVETNKLKRRRYLFIISGSAHYIKIFGMILRSIMHNFQIRYYFLPSFRGKGQHFENPSP